MLPLATAWQSFATIFAPDLPRNLACIAAWYLLTPRPLTWQLSTSLKSNNIPTSRFNIRRRLLWHEVCPQMCLVYTKLIGAGSHHWLLFELIRPPQNMNDFCCWKIYPKGNNLLFSDFLTLWLAKIESPWNEQKRQFRKFNLDLSNCKPCVCHNYIGI